MLAGPLACNGCRRYASCHDDIIVLDSILKRFPDTDDMPDIESDIAVRVLPYAPLIGFLELKIRYADYSIYHSGPQYRIAAPTNGEMKNPSFW